MEKTSVIIKDRGNQIISTQAPGEIYFLDASQQILVRRIVINDNDYSKRQLSDGIYLLFYRKENNGEYVFEGAIRLSPFLGFLSDAELYKIRDLK